MTRLRIWFTTFFLWSYLLVSNIVWWLGSLPIAAVSILTDKRRRLLHLYSCLWGYHYVACLPLWRASWSGRDRIKKDRTYMIVANHQSLGDILVLFGLFRHYKWVSKASIFKVPLIGWNMVANDYVGLVRGDKESIADMLAHCERHLEQGSSIMMFPEGTRSATGKLKAFKHGAFTLARKVGVPIAPIVIDGTLEALPKHGLFILSPWFMRIKVSVLEPISPDAAPDAPRLAELVRQRMADELARLRELPRDEVILR
ncbi:MAG: 1-acyl-sn-glycerol-3-phosphate acyltransferase [Deltaproteobacteria bacterium]|nr:MAG: 1-acyl-sn-glycerol-3-phosphate acyltransferase [Deltaproteobacteria bacterium]